ncbi:hypothetical protein TNCV_619181 [Trichonephila clavipes]|nr:hypothetical protein TNCV_619181 [Trichonephila clavipes]
MGSAQSSGRFDSGAAWNSLLSRRYHQSVLRLTELNGRYHENRTCCKSSFAIHFRDRRIQSYSNEELAGMLIIYGYADCNGHAARWLYRERYPNRRVPYTRPV